MTLMFALFAGLSLGVLLTMVYEKISSGAKLLINQYHVHHSVAGLLLVGLSIVLCMFGFDIMSTLFTFGLGLGNVVQHTREEGLVFLEKELPCLGAAQEEVVNGYRIDLPYGIRSIHIMVSAEPRLSKECQPAKEPTEG
jgi:hypothetical protein